jgi:hypothetical protein
MLRIYTPSQSIRLSTPGIDNDRDVIVGLYFRDRKISHLVDLNFGRFVNRKLTAHF